MAVDTEERQRILDDVNRNWAELIEVLKGFSEDELHIPNVIGIWSLKDLIGHLETWDRISIKKIGLAEQDESRTWWEVEGLSFANIDEFNEADADANRHRSIPDLWEEMIATHQELLTRMQETSALSRELVAVDTYDHYRDHLNDIQRWQSTRA